MKTVALEFIDFLKLAFTPEQLAAMPTQNLEEYRRTFYFAYNAAWTRVGKMVSAGVPEFEARNIMVTTSLELGDFFRAILEKPPQIDTSTAEPKREDVRMPERTEKLISERYTVDKAALVTGYMFTTCLECDVHSVCREAHRCRLGNEKYGQKPNPSEDLTESERMDPL